MYKDECKNKEFLRGFVSLFSLLNNCTHINHMVNSIFIIVLHKGSAENARWSKYSLYIDIILYFLSLFYRIYYRTK